MMEYLYIIERDSDGGYWAYVPDLPGCTSYGDTIDELKLNIVEAMTLWIDETQRAGGVIPPPNSQAGTGKVTKAA